MDPQQRQLLEKGHEALHSLVREHAEPSTGVEPLTGVFVGIEMQDFAHYLIKGPQSVYLATGSSLSIASGRLSFTFGLHGPCTAYVTACSASLAASHAARRSVQLAECFDALASGVNMMLLPGVSIALALAEP